MPTLHIHTPNPTLYIAFLALGLLSAIKSGAISPEAGIWTLRMPQNYDEILPYCPPKLQNIIACFDELDLLFRLDAVAFAQTIDRLLPAGALAKVTDRAQAGHTVRALVTNPALGEYMTHLAQREIWSRHTYSHRVETVLRAVGMGERATRRPTIAPLVSTIRPEQIDHVLETLAGQQRVTMAPVILTHGFTAPARSRARAVAPAKREVRGRGVSSLLPCCSRLLCACSEVSPICGVGILSIIYNV